MSEVWHKNMFISKWGDASRARAKITLKDIDSEEDCKWSQFETSEALKRRNFCHHFEGYESTCFCKCFKLSYTFDFDFPINLILFFLLFVLFPSARFQTI